MWEASVSSQDDVDLFAKAFAEDGDHPSEGFDRALASINFTLLKLGPKRDVSAKGMGRKTAVMAEGSATIF